MLESVGDSTRVQAKDGTAEGRSQKRDCQKKENPGFRQLGNRTNSKCRRRHRLRAKLGIRNWKVGVREATG